MTRAFDESDLTAYALGELEGAPLAALEAALATDPELRRRLEAIRATAVEIRTALQNEPSPGLTPRQRMALRARWSGRFASPRDRRVWLSLALASLMLYLAVSHLPASWRRGLRAINAKIRSVPMSAASQ